MEKALIILDSAIKTLESEIRIWTKEKQPLVVEKCKDELRQVKDAINKLSSNSENLLREVRNHYLYELDEEGHPRAKLKDLLNLWDKVNEELNIK